MLSFPGILLKGKKVIKSTTQREKGRRKGSAWFSTKDQKGFLCVFTIPSVLSEQREGALTGFILSSF
jgi:hypothetical protein